MANKTGITVAIDLVIQICRSDVGVLLLGQQVSDFFLLSTWEDHL
jgi:hypothetical protein